MDGKQQHMGFRARDSDYTKTRNYGQFQTHVSALVSRGRNWCEIMPPLRSQMSSDRRTMIALRAPKAGSISGACDNTIRYYQPQCSINDYSRDNTCHRPTTVPFRTSTVGARRHYFCLWFVLIHYSTTSTSQLLSVRLEDIHSNTQVVSFTATVKWPSILAALVVLASL